MPNYVLPLGQAGVSSNVSGNVAPITTTGTAEPRPTKGRVPDKGQMYRSPPMPAMSNDDVQFDRR